MSTASSTAVMAAPQSIWLRAWEGWKRFAHKLGVFNTRVIMSILYFLVVLPTGLIFKALSDPLQLTEPKDTNWVPLPQHDHNLDTARQQF
jgi:hypothetical protein